MQKGEGKDLLLLHGYMSNKESFYYQINFFSQYFKVTAPDFPCFGASESTDIPWSVGDYAEWLEKFIERAALNSPHILAHSFGARVAFKFLSSRQNAADKLVITGGAGLVKPRSPQYMRKVRAYRRVKRLFPKFAEKHFGSEEYRALSPGMKQSYKLIVNEDLKSCAAVIKNKTLLLYGENDSVTPVSEEGETFHNLLENSKLNTMAGGHFCFSEHPEEFNREVLAFLKS